MVTKSRGCLISPWFVAHLHMRRKHCTQLGTKFTGPLSPDWGSQIWNSCHSKRADNYSSGRNCYSQLDSAIRKAGSKSGRFGRSAPETPLSASNTFNIQCALKIAIFKNRAVPTATGKGKRKLHLSKYESRRHPNEDFQFDFSMSWLRLKTGLSLRVGNAVECLLSAREINCPQEATEPRWEARREGN